MKKVDKSTPEYDFLKKEKLKEQSKLKEIEKDIPFEKNDNVLEWETTTPKATRQIAVKAVVSNYKSGTTNLKRGNISSFNMRKTEEKENKKKRKTIGIDKSMVTIANGALKLSTSIFQNEIKTITKVLKNGKTTEKQIKINHQELKMSNRNAKKYSNLKIEHDLTITYFKGKWVMNIPVDIVRPDIQKKNTYCGIDIGCKPDLAIYGKTAEASIVMDFVINNQKLKKLNDKLDKLKEISKVSNKSFPKRAYNKIEEQKRNMIDEFHWKTIKKIVSTFDYIFCGDIKTHSIVSRDSPDSKNPQWKKDLNRKINDMKMALFAAGAETRLMYYASKCNKYCVLVNESYTSQTCNCCGNVQQIGRDKVYVCKKCKKSFARDHNSGKLMVMKGVLENKL